MRTCLVALVLVAFTLAGCEERKPAAPPKPKIEANRGETPGSVPG